MGWANYVDLFTDDDFYEIVGRTFYWMFLSVALKLILG